MGSGDPRAPQNERLGIMTPKEAVAIAKQQLVDLFAGENLLPPTLEEIWFDDGQASWVVTLGVRRADDDGKIMGRLGLKDIKVVRISNADGGIVSIRDRFAEVATP